jgi:hypothetical protein
MGLKYTKDNKEIFNMSYIEEKTREIQDRISNRPCQSYCEQTNTCLLIDVVDKSVDYIALGRIIIPETREQWTGNPETEVTYQERLEDSVLYARGFLNGLLEGSLNASSDHRIQDEITYLPETKLVYGQCEKMPDTGLFSVGTTATVHIRKGLVAHEAYAYDDNGEEL